jgi:hypothetical protein
MASFTDIVPQFNPYVEQLPIEAMVQVGTYKQQKYDEGIQKIQGYIDNIAGLDVIKDPHKQYLQSKLNQLGNDLKGMAGADFSNYQLVNSVSGMASQIIKDPTIQNAVSSTQRVRKEQGRMDDAKKAGKSSIQNEEWFSNDLNKWLSDGKMDSSYNGEYIEYTDMEKKLREVADKIHEYDNSIDYPFKRDNSGKVILGKDGKPLVDEALLTIKTKGKSAQKILDNFYDSIDENDMRQLRIDGWYHYKGTDATKFEKDIKDNYKEKRNLLNDELVQLNVDLATKPNLSSSQKSKISADIETLNELLNKGGLDKEMKNDIEGMQSDLEGYKYKVYTQKFLTNLAKDISYENVQQEYKDNPFFKADMDLKNLQFKYDDARMKHNEFLMTFNQTEKWKNFERADKVAEKLGTAPITSDERLSTDIDTPTLNALDAEISSLGGRYENGKLVAGGQLQLVLGKYAKVLAGGSLADIPNKIKYLQDLASKYRTNPETITTIKDPNVRAFLEENRGIEIQLGQKRNLYNSAVENSKQFDEEIDGILKGTKGINLDNGSELYSAKDLYDVVSSADEFIYTANVGGGAAGAGVAATTGFNTGAFLNRFKGTRKEAAAIAYAKYRDGESKTGVEQKIVDRMFELRRDLTSKIGNVYSRKLDFQSKFLADRMPERMVKVGTLSGDNKIDMARVENLIGNKLEEYRQGGVDVDKLSDFNEETVADIRKDPKALYTIRKKGDGSAELILSSSGKVQRVPMNATEFTSFFPQYAVTASMDNIKYTVLGSDAKTTNALGRKDNAGAVSAYLSGYDIPNLKNTKIAHLVRLDVEGHPDNNGSASDRFILRMYVNNNGDWKNEVITRDYKTAGQIQNDLDNSIGPVTVADVLKQNP